MPENPYQSPATNDRAIGVNSGSREDLRSVAKYQRGIMLSILGYIILVGAQFAVPDSLKIVLGLALLAVGLAGTVFVFLLAMKVYSTGTGVLLGILTLVPCLGLIMLLIVNGKATKVLRRTASRSESWGPIRRRFKSPLERGKSAQHNRNAGAVVAVDQIAMKASISRTARARRALVAKADGRCRTRAAP